MSLRPVLLLSLLVSGCALPLGPELPLGSEPPLDERGELAAYDPAIAGDGLLDAAAGLDDWLPEPRWQTGGFPQGFYFVIHDDEAGPLVVLQPNFPLNSHSDDGERETFGPATLLSTRFGVYSVGRSYLPGKTPPAPSGVWVRDASGGRCRAELDVPFVVSRIGPDSEQTEAWEDAELSPEELAEAAWKSQGDRFIVAPIRRLDAGCGTPLFAHTNEVDPMVYAPDRNLFALTPDNDRRIEEIMSAAPGWQAIVRETAALSVGAQDDIDYGPGSLEWSRFRDAGGAPPISIAYTFSQPCSPSIEGYLAMMDETGFRRELLTTGGAPALAIDLHRNGELMFLFEDQLYDSEHREAYSAEVTYFGCRC